MMATRRSASGFARRSPCASAFLLGVAACLVSPASAGAAAKAARALVPAQFQPKTDSMGFTWDVDASGVVQDGTDDCFDGAAVLFINGSRFQSGGQAMMTADGSEYAITGRCGGFEVTRWIKVDAKAAAARYVEVVRNTGTGTGNATLMVGSSLGGSPHSWVSDGGAPNPSTLGPKDSGVLAIQRPGTSRPSVVFCVAGPGSQVRPTLAVQHQSLYQFTYSLSVPPGKTVAVLHSVAQRRVGGVPDPKALPGLFRPLTSRAFVRDVAPDVRGAIVNLGGSTAGGAGDAVPDLLATLQKLGVARGNTDFVAIGEETRLRGTAACERLTLSTRFGPLAVPLEKVAALVGPRFSGRKAQLFLRDGQVFGGKLAAQGLRFTMTSGINMDLKLEMLDRLLMRVADSDGKPAPEAALFVETFDGDRLAAARGGDLRLSATTPWGTMDISLDELKWLSVPEEGQPGHLVRLKDGSRFFALLDGPGLKMKTLAFGVKEIRPAEIRSLVAVDATGAEEREEAELAQPHVTLVGETVLVGRVDLPELHFISGGQVIAVPYGQIRTLSSAADEEGGGGTALRAELWGGGTVLGQLREAVLPIRVGDRVCRVPLRDIVSVAVPSPMVPEGLRDRIAQLIRDLGHPEWERRDAASRALGELGHVARPQLAEAVRQTTDPEVRRRAQTLLDEMGE